MDSKARHYIHIVIHLVNLSQPRTATERWFVVLISPSIQEAPELRIPPYYGHTAVVSTVSTLEGLRCISLLGALRPTSEIGQMVFLCMLQMGY